MKLTEKCRKMNNASEEDMNSFLGGAMPMSKAIKCTLTCAMQEYQIVIITTTKYAAKVMA